MNITKAFMWTVLLAAVFVVISLVYVGRKNTKIGHMKMKSLVEEIQRHATGQSVVNDRKNSSLNSPTAVRDRSGPPTSKGGPSRGVKTPEVQRPGPTCAEQTGILLLKTHKTGSSTLQNVLYRFGDARNLTFALPAVDVYMGCPQKFRPAFAIASPIGKYDILANHARFHKDNMKKVMAPGAKFVTILRYPPKQFESMYSFYRMEHRYHCSLETFASSPKTFYEKSKEKNPRHSALNPMLYDLGLDLRTMENDALTERWIQYLDRSFDLVLIAEHLKESLILLKDMMCWTFEDILFFTSNARSGMLVQTLSEKTEKNLLEWLSGDSRLYQHFNTTLWKRIEEYGRERMAADVAELTRRNEELKERCVQGKKKVSEMGGKTVIERYVLRPEAANDRLCRRITYSAINYLGILKNKLRLKRPRKTEIKSRHVLKETKGKHRPRK